ncbi:hypothetical protein MNBD_BACTEROID01-1503 [hydrothermal vent metagenome]|uniref:Uncharacterized protein n=1 Tax=hydrothermal vent metagenome TaxID=652676 RepID=A0A3B0TBU6_9ZZZZ
MKKADIIEPPCRGGEIEKTEVIEGLTGIRASQEALIRTDNSYFGKIHKKKFGGNKK